VSSRAGAGRGSSFLTLVLTGGYLMRGRSG
jgi:hypothetical protein